MHRALAIARRLGGPRAHKVRLGVGVLAIATRCLGRNAGELCNALRIGGAGGDLFAAAIGHAHGCSSHRCALVQRSDPRQRVLAAQLEVHTQIRYQGRRAHIHRALLAQLFVQQRLAQFLRRNLHHMKAGAQGDADHFKRPWVVVGGFGQVQGFDIGLAAQQRYGARLNPVAAAIGCGFGQRALYVL